MTQNSPKISVVVAVYNVEKFLEQCLTSIAGQTFRNTEIICIDDGSTDSSPDILQKFANADERFRIYRKENEGLGGASARNLGLSYARGEYVSILDSDDFFEPEMLEHALRKAEATNADIVVFGGYEYNQRNGDTYKVASILSEKKIPAKEVFDYRDCANDIFQLSQGMAWNKLYRRSFLNEHNIRFQKIKYTDDVYFTFANMILAKRITVLREFLCYYRINSGVNQTAGMDNYPDSVYLPYIELKKFLIAQGAWALVESSFLSCAASFMRYCYDNMSRFDSFSYLHDKLRNEVFKELGLADKTADYFFDGRIFQWIEQVKNNSAGELCFMAARSHGSEATTGILRFRFPYEKIPQESKIAIIGAGIMGRHYYSQLMLSGYCDVVLWAEKENKFNLHYIKPIDELKKCSFEYVVIAYMQPRLVKPIVKWLKKIGISDEKIIIGG